MKKTLSSLAVALGLMISTHSMADSLKVPQYKDAIPPLSVQLWSVKDFIEKDFESTIQQLAEMGFQGVEFAGNFGPYSDNPQELKEFLAGHGLVASGAHVGFDQLKPEVIHKTLLFYKTLDVDLVIVPWDERAWNPEGVKEMVKELNELAPILSSYGMTLGFHNHDQEFNSFKESTYWDYIAKNTPKDFLLQLDVGWVNYAGKDPIDYVKRYPGRTLTTHYKVRTHKGDGKSPIIGDNGYHWNKLAEANITHGGTRWIVVEQEEYPEGLSSMEAVAKSKQGLEKYLKKIR